MATCNNNCNTENPPLTNSQQVFVVSVGVFSFALGLFVMALFKNKKSSIVNDLFPNGFTSH